LQSYLKQAFLNSLTYHDLLHHNSGKSDLPVQASLIMINMKP